MIYYHYSGEVGAIPFPTFAEAVASAELELKEYRDVACDGWAEEAALFVERHKPCGNQSTQAIRRMASGELSSIAQIEYARAIRGLKE